MLNTTSYTKISNQIAGVVNITKETLTRMFGKFQNTKEISISTFGKVKSLSWKIAYKLAYTSIRGITLFYAGIFKIVLATCAIINATIWLRKKLGRFFNFLLLIIFAMVVYLYSYGLFVFLSYSTGLYAEVKLFIFLQNFYEKLKANWNSFKTSINLKLSRLEKIFKSEWS